MKTIRMQLIVMFAIIGIVSIGLLGSVNLYFLNDIKVNTVERTEEQYLVKYDEKINSLVSSSVGVLERNNELYESGELSLEEAQSKAKEDIRKMRYGKDDVGYFWIDNTDYELQLFPVDPSGEGKYRGDLEDQNGTMIIKELVGGALENGEKYLDYYFPKPGEDEASRKRGYVQLFEPWGWVIGTGNYVDDIEQAVNELKNQIEGQINDVVKSFVILIVIILAFIIVSGSLYSNKLSKGIINVKESMEKIAGNDLTGESLEIKEKNELGDLKSFYNIMKSHLSGFVGYVQGSSNQIETSMNSLREVASKNKRTSEEIAVAVGEVAQATVDQAQNTEDTVVEINKLAKDIDKLFSSSKVLNEKVEGINTLNTEGIEKIKALGNWSNKTLESSQNVSNSIKNMDESSKMIEGVTETISKIAEQTNLLALNASIEAARAGDAGKGFAVVADEIRNLAEETAHSTDEIKEKVGLITKVTAEAVESMENTEDIIKKNNIVVNETEKIFSDITNTIKNIVETIDEIFNYVSDIEDKKEEILDNTNNISTASEEISASSEEVSASTEEQISSMEYLLESVEELKDMSDNLAEKTSEFNI